MDSEYIKAPKNGLIKYDSKVIAELRIECNMHNKKDRDKAIAIIQEWIRQQDHFVKKDFDKAYIDRCIICCKGSIERAKKQIDRLCTMRTLMPKYFQTTDLLKSDIKTVFDQAYFALMPRQTPEYYRVIFIKAKPNITLCSNDFTLLFKLFIFFAEYLTANDYSRGFILVGDYSDVNIFEFLYKINLIELQQFVPVLTEGYGCKIKGINLVTSSKLIDGFVSMIKPVFSAKIGNRIHCVRNKKDVRDIVNSDCVPEEYGGKEKPIAELHEQLVETFSSAEFQEIMKETQKAVTDESKRQTDKFNDQYMGMPGSFRTLSLD